MRSSLFSFILLWSLATVHPLSGMNPRGFSRPFLPFNNGTDLYSLQDRVYFFPANRDTSDATVYLPLRRWDIIFTGDRIDYPQTEFDDSNVNRVIPGPFNHIMVYWGKDSRGLAYAIELNTGDFFDPGGLAIICLGADYGILRDPDQADIVDRRLMNRRWAMRFRDAPFAQLLAAEAVIMSRLEADLVLGFPYELELKHSGNLFDRTVYLVDDGFENGAGCSDYWTTLFEEYADICFKDVRMGVDLFVTYFMTDPEGMAAYVPSDISPFTFPITVRSLLGMGYSAVEDAPHVFSCDGSQETGLVLPSLILESELLEEIPGQDLGFTLPGITLKP